MQNCEIKGCKNQMNSLDPKRIYVFDEVLEEEMAVYVCDEHFKQHLDEENDIDWQAAIDTISDAD